jgi:hypothetical protein
VIVDDGMYGKSSWISFSPSIVPTVVIAALRLAVVSFNEDNAYTTHCSCSISRIP